MMVLGAKLVGRMRVMGVGAVLGIGVISGITTAAVVFSISPGGSVTARSGTATLKDTTTGTAITCSSSSSSAVLKSGGGVSGSNLGSATALAFSNCGGPLGLTFQVTTSRFPWTLSGSAFNTQTGVVTGTISGIFATVSGSACSAQVAGPSPTSTGEVTGSYTNGPGTLTTSGGDLHFWNVSGCSGLIANGDSVALSDTCAVLPVQSIIGTSTTGGTRLSASGLFRRGPGA